MGKDGKTNQCQKKYAQKNPHSTLNSTPNVAFSVMWQHVDADHSLSSLKAFTTHSLKKPHCIVSNTKSKISSLYSLH